MKEQDEYVSQLLRIPDGDIGEHVDMDAASVSSTGTSIFDGQARTSTRLAVTRSSRQDVSKEMDNFVKIYDNACLTKDKDDRDDADILRPAVAKMASAFVDHVRQTYPNDVGGDYDVKAKVEGYLRRQQKRYVKRPPFMLTAESARLFPDPTSVYEKPWMKNKRMCSTSFDSELPPVPKAPRTTAETREINLEEITTATRQQMTQNGLSAGPASASMDQQGSGHDVDEQGAAGGARPEIPRSDEHTCKPPTAGPRKDAQTALWAKTTQKQKGLTTITEQQQEEISQQQQAYDNLKGHYSIAQDEVLRQETERKALQAKLEAWRLEQEERACLEAEKEKKRNEEEAKRRSDDLAAATEKLKIARDEQVQKLNQNEEALRMMRLAADEVDRQRAAIATNNAEDELELGAESTGYNAASPRRRATPTRQRGRSANPTRTQKTVVINERRNSHSATPQATPTTQNSSQLSSLDLAWIQTQQLAQTFATNARPAKPFEWGTSSEFKLLMRKFDLVANTRGMDARAKMLELANWFDGAPRLIVDAETIGDDPEGAYERARNELDILFGRNDDATVSLLNLVETGKEIGINDREGHVKFYAQLRAALATAEAADCESEFDRQDVMRKVIDKKVPHLKEKFRKKDEKARARREPRPLFKDLLELIRFRANLLNAAGGQKGATAKIAAAALEEEAPATPAAPQEKPRTETYAEKVAKSPPLKQSTVRCGVCDSFHTTIECATLARLDPDSKVKKLKEKGLCFHCLQQGHEARTCESPRPRCLVCQKPHNTILHGRSFPTPAPRLSARATPFQPASRRTPTQSRQEVAAAPAPTATGTGIATPPL